VCNFPYLGISSHVLGFMGGEKVARSRRFKRLILTKKKQNCDFLTTIVARKMWLKKQHYRVYTRFGGQIQAVHYSGILNSRRWTSYKTCRFLQKCWFPGDQSAMCTRIGPQRFCTYYFLCALLLGTP
jgi:hypothetical protein